MQFPPPPAPSILFCFDGVMHAVRKYIRLAPANETRPRLPKAGQHEPQFSQKSFERLQVSVEPMEARAADQLEAVRGLVRSLLKSRWFAYEEFGSTCAMKLVDPGPSGDTPPYVDPDIEDIVERGRRIHDEWLELLAAVDPGIEPSVREHASRRKTSWSLAEEHPEMSLLGGAKVVAWMQMSFYDLQFAIAAKGKPTEDQLKYLMYAAERARVTCQRVWYELACLPKICVEAERPRESRVRNR